MTQRRPTQEQLGYAIQQLWQLAHHDPATYQQVASILDHLTWLRDAIADAEQAAVYGPGAADIHVKGGSGSAVEQRLEFAEGRRMNPRLRDPLTRQLRKLQRDWPMRLRSFVGGLIDDAAKVAANADQQAG